LRKCVRDEVVVEEVVASCAFVPMYGVIR